MSLTAPAQPQTPALPVDQPKLFLVMDAGTDAGYFAARTLLAAGYSVAVSGRHVGQLSRVVHGYSASQVFAVAADSTDQAQVMKLISSVERRFGRAITSVIRGSSTNQVAI
ncbi:SDR family NAD(P)-dependent oxidoreductase [Mycobacterium sp. ML4]